MTHDSDLEDERLRELAGRLGRRAAERLDVERTAQAVVARLREARPAPAWTWAWPRTVWLRAAAVLLAVLGAGLLARSVLGPTPRAVVPLTPGEDVGDLTADQLREALQGLKQPLTDDIGVTDAGFESLSADELRALLRSLEG